MTTELVRYDAMCHAIEAAYKVDEVKDIRDKARAIEIYSRQARNVEAERQACEIRLRAERRWGQLRKTDVAPVGRPKISDDPIIKQQRSLAELGVSLDQSSQWQKMAEVPDDLFEEAVRQPGATTNAIVALAPKPEKPRDQVDPDALWLWGRLQDFERDGLLARNPHEVMATMLEHMRVTTKELAPRVAKWLGRIAE